MAGFAAGFFAFRDLLAFEPLQPYHLRAEGAEQALFSPQGGGYGVFAVAAAWLLWVRRGHLRKALARGSAWPASPLLVGSVLLYAWAIYVDAQVLLFYVLPLFLIGAGALVAGSMGLGITLRPALLLLVAAPLPGVLLNALVYGLQQGTVRLASLVVPAFGVPVTTVGDRILTPGGIFQVIETCSGVGIATTTTIIAILYTALFRCSRLRSLFLIGIAPVLGFLLNGTRVVSLILWPHAAGTVMHEIQGLVAMVAAVLALYGLDELLSFVLRGRRSPASGRGGSDERSVDESLSQGGTRLTILALVLTSLAGMSVLLPIWEPVGSGHGIPRLPLRLDGWRSSLVSPDHLFLGSVGFSDQAARRYRLRGDAVEVFVGSDDRMNPQRSLISPKTAYPESGWERVWREPFDLPSGAVAELSLFRSYGDRDRQLVLHWRENVSPLAVESLRALLALDRSPFRRAEASRVIRMATSVEEGGVPAARRRLGEFSRLFVPVLSGEGSAGR